MYGDVQEEFGGEGADLLDELFEIFAFDVFHGHVDIAVIEASDIEDGNDIDVLELCAGSGFAHEVFEGDLVIFEFLRQDFESDCAHEDIVCSFIDDAHAAVSDFFDDFISVASDGGNFSVSEHNGGDAFSAGGGYAAGRLIRSLSVIE